MDRRLLPALAAAAALLLPAGPATAAPPPQVVDPPGDANGTAGAKHDVATSAGNQDYADVTSVLWQTTRKATVVKGKRKQVVTGFTVTTTLSAAPTVPNGRILVYRMLGKVACGSFGVAYYSAPLADPAAPQSAIRDDCGSTTRLTKLALPKIDGGTVVWTVPLTAIPKDLKVGIGTLVDDLEFEVKEIEQFPACLPDPVPVYGGACGLGVGTWDSAPWSDTPFRIGS